jgi:hypothetical protein
MMNQFENLKMGYRLYASSYGMSCFLIGREQLEVCSQQLAAINKEESLFQRRNIN